MLTTGHCLLKLLHSVGVTHHLIWERLKKEKRNKVRVVHHTSHQLYIYLYIHINIYTRIYIHTHTWIIGLFIIPAIIDGSIPVHMESNIQGKSCTHMESHIHIHIYTHTYYIYIYITYIIMYIMYIYNIYKHVMYVHIIYI